MDWTTPDGSYFSLREVHEWTEDYSKQSFLYTSVSAYVQGSPYTARLPEHADEIDEGDVLAALSPVPSACIHPKFSDTVKVAPKVNSAIHYLKAPSFQYDDCQPGETFVADCVLNEVTVLELLSKDPHPNIVSYLGCVEEAGRISHICLKRYDGNLPDYAANGLSADQKKRVIHGVAAAIEHLYSLGLAHNDINPHNICIDSNEEPILIDFDGCLPLGEKLMKGTASVIAICRETGRQISHQQNDLDGLEEIRGFLRCVKET
ncbi:kinase-like domain-containing protein [Neohortaea acidophila]|uniref:non-specific serine/threonine protein kinase n=1 Tax=Neohortaea acidophila TaxID=245834 RepID=A0A6A6Q5B3_9PEZI|nr:kinase-like domain-containing protein [Neohortaea acidophila]KAF2487482.1 kinase-like domain-containing protein [Neohortaea acidophila]